MYPSDESQLESYLRTEDYREKVHLEFKQPEDDPDVDALTFNILEKSMTEVCAIANTVRTGKVMIGIYEEKKRGVARGITAGFPQAYRRKKTDKLKPKSKNQIMDDILWSKNLLKKFTPEFGVDELRMNIIDLDNGRVVLIIHIENSKEPRQFGSECYVRRNTKSEKIDFAKMQQMWQDGLIY